MYRVMLNGKTIIEHSDIEECRNILTLPRMGTAIIVYDKDEIKKINDRLAQEANNGQPNT